MGYSESRDVINPHLEEARAGRPSTVELAREMMAGGDAGPRENLIVTLRKEIEVPIRAESPAPAHTFYSLDGFTDYLNSYGSDAVLVMIDPESGRMDGVLDESADDGIETITLRPQPHPLLDLWLEPIEQGRRIPIKEFCLFIAANKSIIRQPDPARLLMVFRQIRLSKNVTIHEGRGAEATNGIVVETRIQGGQVGQVPMNLPETIVIRCPLFADCDQYLDISIDLHLDTDDEDKVHVQMTSSDLVVKRLDAVKSMREIVVGKLKSSAIVCLGDAQRTDRKYLNR